MTSLTETVDQMDAEGRVPRVVIDAHKQTLAALVELAKRVEELEKRVTRK